MKRRHMGILGLAGILISLTAASAQPAGKKEGESHGRSRMDVVVVAGSCTMRENSIPLVMIDAVADRVAMPEC
jgi:hypothetical protein